MPKTISKETIAQLKQKMREDMLRRRAALTEPEKNAAARAVISSFLGNAPIEPKDRIAGYWPVSGEIDIRMLMEILSEQGHVCCLPVVNKKNGPLEFRHWHKGVAMKISLPGIYEPADDAPIVKPKIIIVPLVAFDAKGYRLGFGKGFYDKTIESMAKMKDMITIGVGYEFQKVAEVPKEKHDQKLDLVITEKQTYIFE